jgi:hypothetical protein
MYGEVLRKYSIVVPIVLFVSFVVYQTRTHHLDGRVGLDSRNLAELQSQKKPKKVIAKPLEYSVSYRHLKPLCDARESGIGPIWIPEQSRVVKEPVFYRGLVKELQHIDQSAVVDRNYTSAVHPDRMFYDRRETLPIMKDGTVPWLGGSHQSNGPYSEDAQRTLYNLQHPRDCKTARFLVHRSPQWGIGADMYFAAVDLLHALLMGRVFIFERPWKWASGPCEKYGFDCYFIPATHCTMADAGPVQSIGAKGFMRNATNRSVRKAWYKTADLRLFDVHDTLFPANTVA